MEKMIAEILQEIKGMKQDINKRMDTLENKIETIENKIDNLEERNKITQSSIDELFAIQKTILERSQFYSALKERVDLVTAKNDHFQYEVYKNYVRKDKLIELLKAL